MQKNADYFTVECTRELNQKRREAKLQDPHHLIGHPFGVSPHPSHGPGPHFSPPGSSAPASVVLQQGQSPASHSPALSSHGPCHIHPGLLSSPQLPCSWLGGWKQILVARLCPASLAPAGPSSWPWGSCWHGQHSDHQCRTIGAISGSKVTERPLSSLATSILLGFATPWKQDWHT